MLIKVQSGAKYHPLYILLISEQLARHTLLSLVHLSDGLSYHAVCERNTKHLTGCSRLCNASDHRKPNTGFKIYKKKKKERSACLAQLREHAILDLGVMSLSSTLGGRDYLIFFLNF